MARYYVGTAGWSYEDWAGIVYPLSRRTGFHPLTYLAAFINIVEVNSTFYRPPVLAMSLSWVKKIPADSDFLFSVKLHQSFTHERKGLSQEDVDVFKRGLEPIVAARRLAALLIQFPWSFSRTPANDDYLARLFGLFAGYPLALEVRHASWDRPDFYKMLHERRVAFCNIDQPVIGASIKPTEIVTQPEFSYVRLHGRNYADWFREDAGRDARYNYLYKANELEEWVERIRQLGQGSDRVYVITNNHYRGQALANALQIQNMITGEKLEIPKSLLKQYPVLEDIVRKIRKGQLDLFEKDDTDKGEKR
jgi:uncharacterized protein YecE (DUF72 family)